MKNYENRNKLSTIQPYSFLFGHATYGQVKDRTMIKLKKEFCVFSKCITSDVNESFTQNQLFYVSRLLYTNVEAFLEISTRLYRKIPHILDK